MLIGKKAKPESPEEMALVHHALESPIRRNMIILMNQGVLSVPQIAAEDARLPPAPPGAGRADRAV
jgi:hypothetical protein